MSPAEAGLGEALRFYLRVLPLMFAEGFLGACRGLARAFQFAELAAERSPWPAVRMVGEALADVALMNDAMIDTLDNQAREARRRLS